MENLSDDELSAVLADEGALVGEASAYGTPYKNLSLIRQTVVQNVSRIVECAPVLAH